MPMGALRRSVHAGRSRLAAGAAAASAWLLLGIFAAMLRFVPFRILSRSLGQANPPATPPPTGTGSAPIKAVRAALNRAVDRAPFRSDCLPQALCAVLLCRCRNVPTATYLGVREDGERLSAHAWVVAGGIVVSGADGRERFRAVACFLQPGRPDARR